MVYTLNIYHFRTINMYETFHIVCVIFITWAQKGNLRKLITIYLIVFLYVQTYWIYLGEIGSHQDIFHFTKIKSISPSFFLFHQDFLDFTKSPPISPSENFTKSLTKCGWPFGLGLELRKFFTNIRNFFTNILFHQHSFTNIHLSFNLFRALMLVKVFHQHYNFTNIPKFFSPTYKSFSPTYKNFSPT